MTVKIWDGATAAFETASDWGPVGTPAAGDDATIASGVVTEGGTFAGNLILHLTASSSSSPRLVLSGATLPATTVLAVNGAGSSPAIQVQGGVTNLGAITVTSSAPGSATFLVRDAADGTATTLTNAGSIAVTDGIAQFLDFGGNATKMTNNGTIAVGSTGAMASSVYVGLPLDGTGDLLIGSNGTAEFAGTVGSGQVATFVPGGGPSVLQLDTPGTFQGTVKGFVSTDQIVLGAIAAPTLTYASTSATSGVVQVSSNGAVVAQLNVQGVYAASDFSLATSNLGNGQSSVALDTTATTPQFSYTDTVSNTSGTVTPDLYSGPVNYLQYQYIWGSTDSVAISANRGNVFLHGGVGDDALAVQSGNNVIDGGAGSNFLVGGTGSDGGADTFFIDGRGAGVSWGTLVNFHHGDSVTVFGFTGGVSTLPLQASDGAAGYTGATIHSELNGAGTGVNASITFAGVSIADAQDVSNGGKFSYSFSSVGGTPYMNIAYTG